MFTGIVETIGTVSRIEQLDTSASGGDGTSILITGAEAILNDCHDGDSISVNGTCLTVTWFDAHDFKVGISPETLRRTTLGSLAAGSRVNLERAVSGETRLGGHMVQGHVDTVATVSRREPDGNALTLRFAPRDAAVLRYVVEKGFVAVDGASLTVTAVEDPDARGEGGWWEVMLVAYTQSRIVTADKKVGDAVNLEVDMVGKYVEKNVKAWFDGQEGGSKALELVIGKLVDDRLKARGL